MCNEAIIPDLTYSYIFIEFFRRGQNGGGYNNENRENNSRGGYNNYNSNGGGQGRGGYNNQGYNNQQQGSQQGHSGFNNRFARDGNMRGGGDNLAWSTLHNLSETAANLSR